MSSTANVITRRIRDKRTHICNICGDQRRMPRLCTDCTARLYALTKQTYELAIMQTIARMRRKELAITVNV